VNPFPMQDFARALEDGFGISVKSVSALPGMSHSLNFKVTDAAGSTCVFKCVHGDGGDALKRVFAHARSIGSECVPKLLFDGKTVDFGGYRVFAITWMYGERKMADRLSHGEIASLVERSGELLGALRDDGFVLPARDLVSVRGELLARLDQKSHGELYEEIEAINAVSLVRDPARTCIIHGDLNPGNVRFSRGRVSGFLDIEELRLGYRAEDLVRFAICSAEHVKWYEFWRTAGVRRAFAEMVRIAGIPADEWLLAINGYLLWKLKRKVLGSTLAPALRMRMKWRIRLYRDMRMIVLKATK